MVGHGAKSGQVHYYGCPTKMKCGADQCPSALPSRDAIEAAVVQHLSEHVLQVAHLRSILDEINATLDITTAALATDAETKRAQLGTQRQQLNRLIDALALGTIDPAAIADRINDLKRSTDLLQAQLANLEARLAEARPVELTDAALRAYVEGLRDVLATLPLDERRAFLQAWIREITATGRTLEVEYTLHGYGGSDVDPTGGSSRKRGAASGVNQIRRVLATAGSGAPGWSRESIAGTTRWSAGPWSRGRRGCSDRAGACATCSSIRLRATRTTAILARIPAAGQTRTLRAKPAGQGRRAAAGGRRRDPAFARSSSGRGVTPRPSARSRG